MRFQGSNPCEVDPACVVWEKPDPESVCCDCLDLTHDNEGNPVNPADWQLWCNAWNVVTAYVYNKTCRRWPGKVWREETRPCVSKCGHIDCICGRFSALNLGPAFCFPICDIIEVRVAPTVCAPEGNLWTPGDGVRLEHGPRQEPLLVIEDSQGCCGWWPHQDLCKPNGDPGSWSISARTGANPPPDILAGVTAMTCCLAQECISTGCSLPKGLTTLTRRGTSMQIDPDQPASLELRILEDLFTEYGCDPADFEQFCDPSEEVRFHSVHGPIKIEDEPTACETHTPPPVVAP
jgi:hypothetical protein